MSFHSLFHSLCLLVSFQQLWTLREIMLGSTRSSIEKLKKTSTCSMLSRSAMIRWRISSIFLSLETSKKGSHFLAFMHTSSSTSKFLGINLKCTAMNIFEHYYKFPKFSGSYVQFLMKLKQALKIPASLMISRWLSCLFLTRKSSEW